MTREKSRGIAFFLSSMPIVGWMGWDKLYMGAYILFFIQFFATVLVMGCLFSFPMAIMTSIMLFLSSFLGAPLGPSLLFPQKVIWRPASKADRVLIMVMVFVYLYVAIMMLLGFLYKDVIMNGSARRMVSTRSLSVSGPLHP